MMIPEVLDHSLMQMAESVRTSIDRNLQLPSLILIYSGIDIAGWLSAKSEKTSVRESFTNWVNLYMIPSGSLACTSIELYSARCAILHTLTPDSRLSRSGEAKRVAYAWGDSSRRDLEIAIAKSGTPELLVIHIEDLFNSFRVGWKSFIDAYEADQSIAPLFVKRANQVYVSVPKKHIEDFINSVQ
jgi:hypothetical protein